jgi:hypothetical protein
MSRLFLFANERRRVSNLALSRGAIAVSACAALMGLLMRIEGGNAIHGISVIASLSLYALAFWFAPRAMAGPATGAGRFGKWMLTYAVLIIVVSFAAVTTGVMVDYMVGAHQGRRIVYWLWLVLLPISMALLMPYWLRMIAFAISGDRTSLATIQTATVVQSWRWRIAYTAASTLSMVPMVGPWARLNIQTMTVSNPAALAGIGLEMLGAALQVAILVAAYLAIDDSADTEYVRQTFG